MQSKEKELVAQEPAADDGQPFSNGTKTEQGQQASNPITDSESGLDVDVSVLLKRGWRPTLETQYPEPEDPEAEQWISFRNNFWAKTSLDVSVGTVLDLSPWPDALQLLQLSSFRLLVRQEYADFYERLIDAAGIGKSGLLIYILIRRLVSTQATVLVLDDIPYLFRFDGTYSLDTRLIQRDPLRIIHSVSPSLRPWILIDTPKTPTLPPSWLTKTISGFPILAASLDERRYKPLVWNEQELTAILPFLLGPDVIKPRPTTMSLIQDCGYCIRDLALAIRAPRTVLQDREKALSAIEDSAKNVIRIINNAHQASSEQTFHQLFIVRRIGDVALCESDCYTVDVKSQGVLASLMQVHRRLDVLSARRIFMACRSSSESSFAAWAFEHIAHHYLASGCRTTCLEMTAFKGGSRFFHSAWDIIAEEFVVSSSSVRVEALKTNKTSLFDAFFVSRGIMEKPVLWVVQTTMAARLGGGSAQDGYVSMETIRERLGDDCSVKYVLVVPLHRNRAYRWEMPDGWNDHEGQVFIQYINMDTES
ncbi:hypothetical protein CPB85DRAFT_1282506 [Mucidula mucida]|nr:hypothetical protein CPB85DRAFT_1282506 [Mucidula mucida]